MMGTEKEKILITSAGASEARAVPGIGTLLGIGSQVILAGASTYALGKVFQYRFENDGTLYNFYVDEMKEKGCHHRGRV
ncbi:MAG: hypothetical protein GF409_00550 [Candidatus Omnitrophica bacterium]|nr:hypothetical protein [Candidatus Omnitrophota bacterium]